MSEARSVKEIFDELDKLAAEGDAVEAARQKSIVELVEAHGKGPYRRADGRELTFVLRNGMYAERVKAKIVTEVL